jgi:hypothetical protein
VVLTSIFLEKSILNFSRCQFPNEDPPLPHDCRRAEEIGAGQAPVAEKPQSICDLDAQ